MYEMFTVRFEGDSKCRGQVYKASRCEDDCQILAASKALHSIRTCFDATEHALRLDKPQIFTRTLER